MTDVQKREARDLVGKIQKAAQDLAVHVAKAGAGAAVVEAIKHLIG
jgi:hypothetical protein